MRHPEAQSMFLVRDGKLVWKYSKPMRTLSGSIQEFDDATLLSNGNIVFACMSGAGIISPDKNLVWEFHCPEGTETHSCQPIGKDSVLMVLNGNPAKVLIVNTAENKILKEIVIPTTTTNTHVQFRHVRMTRNGTIMVGLFAEKKVVELTMEGKEIWSVSAVSPWSAVRLHNGNTLISGDGAGYTREVNRKGETVWEFTREDAPFTIGNTQTANRLANGNTFVGECNAGRLLELAPDGKLVKEIRLLPAGKDGGHLYMRNARQLANGNYLVAHYGEQVVREYDSRGRKVREIPAPGGPHSVIRLPNGNTLIACGDMSGAQHVSEVDKDGQTVWEVKADELPGISLKFMTGLQRLPNGNTVLSNWLGHGQFGKAPHLIEVTRDKGVVWTFFDHQTMKTVSSVQLLDVPGDATKGEVWH